MHDIADETRTVLELCEALTCSNVGTATIQEANEAKNARRVRDGKLPLFETKVLTLNVPQNRIGHQGEPVGVERAGPRHHLRRGHIRNLADGRRIWVPSCSVGDPLKGVVDKTYSLRKAS